MTNIMGGRKHDSHHSSSLKRITESVARSPFPLRTFFILDPHTAAFGTATVLSRFFARKTVVGPRFIPNPVVVLGVDPFRHYRGDTISIVVIFHSPRRLWFNNDIYRRLPTVAICVNGKHRDGSLSGTSNVPDTEFKPILGRTIYSLANAVEEKLNSADTAFPILYRHVDGRALYVPCSGWG